MPNKLYNISIGEQERRELEKIVSSGKYSSKEVLRANILLNSDSSGGRVPVKTRELASLLSTSTTTVQNVRRGYSNSSMEETIKRKKRETPPVAPKVDGEFEARLIALACQQPPEGYAKWNLRLLAEKSVELNYIDNVSHMTISRVLKKTNLSLN
jgi:Arc/MetJ-type ribon-helix-helix transcriptional regulator